MVKGFFKIGSCKSRIDAKVIRSFTSLAGKLGIETARQEALSRASDYGPEAQRIRALLSVVADLLSHGWHVELAGDDILAMEPGSDPTQNGREYTRRIQLGQ